MCLNSSPTATNRKKVTGKGRDAKKRIPICTLPPPRPSLV